MNASQDEIDLSRAPLLSHLLELRRRLLYVLGFFAVAFVGSYLCAEYIYAFLTQPLHQVFGEDSGRRMIYTALHEAFLTYIKLAFFTALFISLPLILNQVWKFLAPGLYQFERQAMRPFFLLTPVLFLAGAALAYYVVFPLAWEFFLNFESQDPAMGIAVQLEARVSEYLSLVIQLIFAFGLSFELPILLLLLARLGMVTAESLAAHRKHAIIGAFAFAAVITPPDLISQIALGTPILVLYEVSILLIKHTSISVVPRTQVSTS